MNRPALPQIPPQVHPLDVLTAREEEVLHWVAEGKSNWQIGQILGCSEETVKKHLQHIYRKMGVETRTAAAAIYLRAKPLLEAAVAQTRV